MLALPLAGNFDLQRSIIVREKLLDAVAATRARDVVIDVTGLGMIDDLTANELVRLTSSLALLGARAYLTGISAANAQTMVSSDARVPAGMCMRSLESALRIIAHTDTSGSIDYNQALSERRANAVVGALITGGIDRGRVVSEAVGQTQPLVPTGDGVREQGNRVAEIDLL